MTAAPVTAMFVEEEHPRAAGGQFGTKSKPAGSQPSKTGGGKTTPRKQAKRRQIPKGQLGFDGITGTGYGMPYGDKRVRALQEQLNRLGLTDMRGRPLRVDGKLGPLTTSAIRKAQRRLGMKPTGIIDPAFIDRLRATKAMPAPKAPGRKRVQAGGGHYDPHQLRDAEGQWTVTGAIKDALKIADTIPLDDGETFEGSSRVSLPDADVRMALTREADGSPSLRFGVDTVLPAKWRGMNGGYTVKLDRAGTDELTAKIGDLAKASAAAERQADRMWSDIEDRASQVGADPNKGRKPGQADFGDPELDRLVLAYDAFVNESLIGDGAVDSPWGQLYYRSIMTDSGPSINLLVTKPGARLTGAEALQDAHDYADPAELDLAGLRKLATALAKIRDASAAPPAGRVTAAELRGIELARPGKWQLSSGPLEITDQHITDAARYAQRKGARPGYVKIGHTDKRFAVGDGEPALGWVENVRREVDDLGPKLVGDINDMPEWLAATAPKAWPYRSMEGWADYTDPDTGEKYALVLDGVALLGVTPPGMTSLQSLRDLPQAVGIAAASGVRVVASMASAPVAVEEGAGPMDPAKIREALGLSADAPDDEVGSALTVAAATLTGGDPAPAPVQASLFGDEPKAKAPAQPGMPTLPKGVQVIASSKLDELNETIKSLSAFVEQSKRKERDEVIATAVQAGKFTPAQRADFVRMWDEAPDATRSLIEKLTPNSALAVMAAGYAGGITQEEDELDRELARLSRPEVRNG